jgi:hypothetical protein
MTRELIEECHRFALHIENRDAKTWNNLCRELTVLYKCNKERGGEEKVFDFVGFDACHKVVDGMYGDYFHAHCADKLKNLFYQRSRAVKALAAQEVLFHIKAELEIGNYYD